MKKPEAGDTVTFTPLASERFAEPITGTVVEIIKGTADEVGYHIHAPLPDDPTRVLRVWEHRGTIAVAFEIAEGQTPTFKLLGAQEERIECGAVITEEAGIPCCMCGKLTTRDSTYGDLCYRCIRANNE